MRRPTRTARAAAAVVGALVLAGCGSTQPASSPAKRPPSPATTAPAASTTTGTASPYGQPPAVALAADESALSVLYDGCAGTCAYETASTPDGAGGTLYAIEVEQQYGDGYGRGAIFFFHGETLLAGTGALAPGTSVEK
jgi:hypothetical protein